MAYLVEYSYPAGHRYGEAQLQPGSGLGLLAAWAGEDRIGQCQPQGFAYIDIETTGLSGGSGTYAFLIGAGRLTSEGFYLAQFFMRDPAEEPAQLLALEEFLAPCETIVTYNGKAFDIPILTTRYITQGWKSPFRDLAHLDLLPLARKLWRERLPSRTLGNVETFILGARRTEEDVPGWIIPSLFFNYLRDGDARPLKGVFYHNLMDVLAMAGLLNHISHLFADPLHAQVSHGLDLVGLGRFYEDLELLPEATGLYRRSLDAGLPEELFWATLQRLSFICKRCRDYTAALHLWEQAAQHGQIYACVELAKYYEHTARDIEAALDWTGVAIQANQALPYALRLQWADDLLRRSDRLGKKLGKSSAR
jgi:uncharacterized protein YprB with RNaseH-like and TPR domain